mgnify:FL=1
MNQINLNLPKGIKVSDELLKRCQLAILPEVAESHALDICEKHFNKSFKLGKYNSKGYDIISLDGSIIVEVKQTSCVMLDGSKRLQINAFKNKENLCTHILILDYYSNRGAILKHDDFFYKTHHYPKSPFWRWDSEYNASNSKRCQTNTEWFLKNEIKL